MVPVAGRRPGLRRPSPNATRAPNSIDRTRRASSFKRTSLAVDLTGQLSNWIRQGYGHVGGHVSKSPVCHGGATRVSQLPEVRAFRVAFPPLARERVALPTEQYARRTMKRTLCVALAIALYPDIALSQALTSLSSLRDQLQHAEGHRAAERRPQDADRRRRSGALPRPRDSGRPERSAA